MEKLLNTELVGVEFHPSGESRAVLIIVHGFGEHHGRYELAAHRLVDSRFSVYTFDLRGHGQLLDERTKRQRFSNFTDDLASLVKNVSEQFPGKSIFLWGHSMGSIVVLDLALMHPENIAGCITTGCPLRSIPKAVQTLGGLGAALTALVPAWSFNAGLDPKLLSHDVAVQADYANDPLVTPKITLNLAFEFARTVEHVAEELVRIEVPWLAVHGSEDEIAPEDGSRELIDELGSADKTLEIIEGARHEVHNEVPEYRDRFFNLITEWMNDRLNSPGEAPVPVAQVQEY